MGGAVVAVAGVAAGLAHGVVHAMHVGIRSLLIYVLYNICIAEIVS